MNENEFRDRLIKDRDALGAWGEFVSKTIFAELERRLGGAEKAKAFLKIPVEPRVKDVDSAIEKAFIRKKYSNPYAEVTDKVGVRFVTLLTDDIRLVEEAVTAVPHWLAEMSRDYAEEVERSPETFEYQSLHYVVTNKKARTYNKVKIPKGMTCEIQIRSMLQHVYCELTHKIIYKTKGLAAAPQTRRYVARSMALIETTDELLLEVSRQAPGVTRPHEALADRLATIYRASTGLTPILGTPTEDKIIDTFRDLILAALDQIEILCAPGTAVSDFIKERAERNAFFRLPVIPAVYFLVQNHQVHVDKNWPLGSKDKFLTNIYTDMGIARD